MAETPRERRRRRIPSVTVVYLLFLVVTVLSPLLLVAAVIVDLVCTLRRRRPWMAVRLLAMGWVYLAVEAVGLVVMLVVWLRTGFGRRERRLLDHAYGLQRWWGSTLLAAARRIFRLGLEVEGDDQIQPGPIVLLMRHASIVDNLLPLALVTDTHGMEMRWIIKKELLRDPALDIVGNILPNYFVDRAGVTSVEVGAIRRLATDLDERGGVMIYPEGTRFTAQKQQRALQRLERSDPELAERARRLRHTLPPRPAGTLAILNAAPDADVVVGTHVGLDGFAHIKDIWAGSMVGRTIKVAFRRIPRSQVPTERSERLAWLLSVWQWVDDWIDANREPG